MNDDSQKRHGRVSRKIWVLLVVVGAVLAALLCLYLALGRDSVERRLEALCAAGYPTSLAEWAESHRLPEGAENAAVKYEAAFNVLAYPYDDANVPVLGSCPLPARGMAWQEPMVAAVLEFLTGNQSCLALLHEAAGIEQCRYNWQYIPTSPDFRGVRDCARLLELDMLFHAQEGDADAVVSSFQSALRLSDSLRYEPTLIAYLVRMSCLGVSLAGLERALSTTSFADGQLYELDGMLARTVATLDFTEAMVSERCAMIEMFPDPSQFWSDGSPALLKLPGVVNTGLTDMLDCMVDVVEASKLPPTQRLLELRAIVAEQQKLPFWHFVWRDMTPVLCRLAELDLRLRARIDLARTAWVIERYRLSTGEVPGQLDVLVPRFLDAVPIDPFDGQPIRYRPAQPGYLLYSIMEDGQDNGGLGRDEVNRGEPCDWPFIVTR